MKIDEIRRRNLLSLIDDNEPKARLAAMLDITPGYLSQIIGGHRPFSEKTARKFETQLGLNDKQLDIETACLVAPMPRPALAGKGGEVAPERHDMSKDELFARIVASLSALDVPSLQKMMAEAEWLATHQAKAPIRAQKAK